MKQNRAQSMVTKLLFKREVKPNIFVVCTHRNNEYQIQLQHESGIKYEQTKDDQQAIKIIQQYIEEASK
jgi:hypothetical protein